MLAALDGALVTQQKTLTDRAIEAVRRLHAAGILFAITGGRPPRGMGMLVKPIDLQSPLAACSGLSIAMGNADPQVKRAARRITDTNDNDGFARAVERYLLHDG